MTRTYTASSTSAVFSSQAAAAEAIRVANGWDSVVTCAAEQVEPDVDAVWAYETDAEMFADQTGAAGERIEIRESAE